VVNITEAVVKLSLLKKILVLVGMVVVIVGAYGFLIFMPQREEIRNKKEELGKLETQVRELRIVHANMERFKAEAAKLKEELKIAIAQLPTSKEIPSLLANISSLGKESGLDFLLFRPAPEINREFYAEIPVEIRVRGTYVKVATFFDKVGKLPRIVNIAGVNMEGAKEISGKLEIMTSCTATTFKFIERKEIPEPAKDQKESKKEVPMKR
jgi:type IV pilus assembly protein PilO